MYGNMVIDDIPDEKIIGYIKHEKYIKDIMPEVGAYCDRDISNLRKELIKRKYKGEIP
jgi:hypothetical protein